MGPSFKSYSSYKFDQPKTICDQAKVNLVVHHVQIETHHKSFRALSVWNFCCLVTDVPPCEMSPVGRSGERWLCSRADKGWAVKRALHSSFNV